MEIQQDLDELRQSLENAQALHEWKELKASERKPGTPPAFQIYDPVNDDLNLEVNYFVSRAIKLHRTLDRRTEDWAIIARNELISMERDMAAIKCACE